MFSVQINARFDKMFLSLYNREFNVRDWLVHADLHVGEAWLYLWQHVDAARRQVGQGRLRRRFLWHRLPVAVDCLVQTAQDVLEWVGAHVVDHTALWDL